MAEHMIVHDKAIKLMPVHGEVLLAAVSPNIFLVDAHAYQVRHDIR